MKKNLSISSVNPPQWQDNNIELWDAYIEVNGRSYLHDELQTKGNL